MGIGSSDPSDLSTCTPPTGRKTEPWGNSGAYAWVPRSTANFSTLQWVPLLTASARFVFPGTFPRWLPETCGDCQGGGSDD